MNEGVLVTASLSLIAGGLYARVATRAARRDRLLLPVFVLASATLLLAGARQAIAYAAPYLPALQAVDLAIFIGLAVPGAFAIVPLVRVAALTSGAPPRAATALAAVFVVVGVIGLSAFLSGGFSGPIGSFWASEWQIESETARAMAFAFMLVPALVASTVLFLTARKAPGPEGRRLRYAAGSFVLLFSSFTLDAAGAPGAALLGVRALAVAGGVLATVAYGGWRVRDGREAEDAPADP